MKADSILSIAAFALLLGVTLARGQTVTYNFDSAQWASGATTPFLNKAPDSASGVLNFQASFTSSPTAGAFAIGSAFLNPSFSGQCLYQPGNPPGDTLTITLSQPVHSVHMDFIQFAPGHFDFTSAAGNASTVTASQIGSLDFQSATAFSSFTLEAFNTANSPLSMGIDNLTMTIPEPSSCALAGLGGAALMLARRRK